MNTEKNIAIACFMGAALGTLLALQFGYFWWIGILMGGAAGYILFRLKEAIRAVRHAWSSLPDARAATVAARNGVWNFVCATGAVLAMLCFALSILIMIVGLAMSLGVGTEMSAPRPSQAMAVQEMVVPAHYWMVGAGVLLFAAVLLLAFVLLAAKDRKAAFRTILNCFLLTPLVLPFTLAFAIGSALLPYACKGSSRLAVLCFKLARRTFILVHSELRLLCLTDAMIGSVAGYFCGNALIGGVVGAVCGLANYKLVSVKWLKLEKAT